ncbi:MAG: EAL domain-containing protein [Gammaproteobacteria bacterium]|nr:EAL domain-containing protein [Gammaproteobacteria bacterium]
MKAYGINLYSLLILILLLICLSIFYTKSKNVDSQWHEQSLQYIYNAIESNDNLEKDILLIRLGSLRNYDSINKHFRNIEENFNRLNKNINGKHGYTFSNVEYENFISQLNTKEDKTINLLKASSQFQNSLMYFNLKSKMVAEKIDNDDISNNLKNNILSISNLVILSIRNPYTDTADKINIYIKNIERITNNQKNNKNIESIIAHGKVITKTAPVLNNITEEIKNIRIDMLLHKVHYSLHNHIQTKNEKAREYKNLLFASTILLVFYIAYIFFRLKITAAELLEKNSELFTVKEKTSATLNSIADGVITTNKDGIILFVNEASTSLLNIDYNYAVGKNIHEILEIKNESTGERVIDRLSLLTNNPENIIYDSNCILESTTENTIPIHLTTTKLHTKNEDCAGVVFVIHDISEERHLEKIIQHQAIHDSLTGLINRFEFDKRLTALIEAEDDTSHALLYIDLDQFKIVNDTCGHIAGDELLKQISLIIRKTVRDSDTVARLGGDEFGILLKNCTIENAITTAENIRENIKGFKFSWEKNAFDIGASIGVIQVNPGTVSLTEILSQADVACYAAKDLGRNRVHVHTDSDEELIRRHSELNWISSLKTATDSNRFKLYSQAIVPLNNTYAHSSHYEILLRYIDNDGNEVSPGAFIPAAERYGFMSEIDKWVIENTLRKLYEAKHILNSNVMVSINLSGNSLNGTGVLTHIKQCMRAFYIPPELLCFEITETAAISNLKTAVEFIEELKKLGCAFSLDDFGSGLSSFAYLKNLPVDYLKIDGEFVKDIHTDTIDKEMVIAINSVGHAMGKKTIAEFVENQKIKSIISEIGIDFAQGYGIEKPVLFDDILKRHCA